MAFITWLTVARELWELLQVLVKGAEVEGVDGDTKHSEVMDALKKIYEIVGGLPGVKGTPAWGVVSVLATQLIPAIVAMLNRLGVFKSKVAVVVMLGMMSMGGFAADGVKYVNVCERGEGGFPKCEWVEMREQEKVEFGEIVWSEGDAKRDGWELRIPPELGVKEENILYVAKGYWLMGKALSVNGVNLCAGRCWFKVGNVIKVGAINDSQLGIDTMYLMKYRK